MNEAGWRTFLILSLTQLVGWGTTYYAPTVLAQPIMAETGWSKTFVYGAFSWSLLLGAVLAGPAGRWIDRSGPRLVMAVGSLLAALGCATQALATTQTAFLLAWTLLGAAMRLMLYEAAFAALAQATGDAARRWIAWLTIPGGFASSVFWPIGYALAEGVGWRTTLLIFAALNLLLCLPMHLLLPVRSEARAKGPVASAPAMASAPVLTGTQRQRAILLLTAALALNAFVFSALSAHFVTLFTALGLAAATVVGIAALKGVAQVAGRLWEIGFGRRLRAITVGIVATALLPLAFLVLPLGVTVFTLLAFTLLYGASNGLVTIVRGAVPIELFGTEGYGQLLGRMTAPGLVMSALAPGLFAIVFDGFGVVAAMALLFAAALASFGIVVVLAMRLKTTAARDEV
jgi:predicted MFS family arabinose efflux permease